MEWLMRKLGYIKAKKIAVSMKNGSKIIATTGNDNYPATPRQLKDLLGALEKLDHEGVGLLVWNHTLKLTILEMK